MGGLVHSVEYRGYTIEIRQQDNAGNPLKEYDQLLTLVLHRRAEQHFGWTTDQHYADLLNEGMERAAEHSWRRAERGQQRYDTAEAIELVCRWLRAYHGVTVTLPFGVHEHSGTSVYLGSGSDTFDPQGWDSGWIGLAIDTPERRKVMGFTEQLGPSGQPWNHPEIIEKVLQQDFEGFAAWVASETYGWVVEDPAGDTVQSVWGYYGDREWAEWAHKDDGDPPMISEAKAVVDFELKQQHETRTAHLKQLVALKPNGGATR